MRASEAIPPSGEEIVVSSEVNESGVNDIPNRELSSENLPPPNSKFWGVIDRFALSFDGYAHRGSFEKCAEIANAVRDGYRKRGKLPRSLTDLRTCLFFEQRRWRHFDEVPDNEALEYVYALVEAIRERVTTGEIT